MTHEHASKFKHSKMALAIFTGVTAIIFVVLKIVDSQKVDPATCAKNPEGTEQQLVSARIKENCVNTGSARSTAKMMATEFIEKALNAPATAKFVDVQIAHLAGCDFFASGEVDAQNGFGSMNRSSFKITIKYLPDIDSWQRVSHKIYNQ